MSGLAIGQTAPSFRLPSGQGTEVGPADYRDKKNLIVWFTKGFACPFCRQQMTQLVRGYPQFQRHDAEVLEIAITTPPRARVYLQKFQLPFPYLCDPDYRVHNEWKLASPPYGPLHVVRTMWTGMTTTMPENDYFKGGPPMDEMRNVMRDDEMGFFIVDKQGVVRYAVAGSYIMEVGTRKIPSGAEILAELAKIN